jgi:hypothetical protein
MSSELDAAKEKLRREAEVPAARGSRVTKRFTNEIGNPISISVTATKDTGTNAKTKKRSTFDAVKIVITGPTSTSENTLTRQEAAELLSCLSKFKP